MDSPIAPPSTRLSLFSTPIPWLAAFWKFSRPHTILGTSLSVISLFALAWVQVNQTPLALPPLVNPFALIVPLMACLAGNVYIVGLNQLQDVAIDRINKPTLPLAAGEFSQRDGWTIVTLAAGIGLGLAALGGPFLLGTVALSLAIGTAYSLPPLRLKRFPFLASLCILVVRGAIVNLGLYGHYQEQLGLPGGIPGPVWALGGFIVVFSIAIAILKDIPDLEGDRRYQIPTFANRLGQRPVFFVALALLTLNYLALPVVALAIPNLSAPAIALIHGLLLLLLAQRSRPVLRTFATDTPDTATFSAFYQFIWQLFFLEYLLYPLASWLA